MLNSVRAYRIFFGLFKTSNSLWGDFYTSWASPGWRRYHLCITRGDQEDCNLSWTSVKMGELGFRELESHSRFGGEVGGWFAEPFSAKTNICFFPRKNLPKSMSQWDERASFFFGMSETFPTFFWRQRMGETVKLWWLFFPDFWSLDSWRFGHVFKQCIWQEVSWNFSNHPKRSPRVNVIAKKNS